MRELTKVELERFWMKIDKSPGHGPDGDCWIWTASGSRYGRFGIDGKTCLAHRVSYELANGQAPGKLNVLHHCDNTMCVNPDHLWLGTQADNIRDAAQKGRLSGRQTKTKLTTEEVIKIRKMYAANKMYAVSKISHRKLAVIFKVHHTTIGAIVRRDHWTRI